MSDRDLLVMALCMIPLVTIAVSIFACELRVLARERDTRRYPKYGKSPYMRNNGKRRKEE